MNDEDFNLVKDDGEERPICLISYDGPEQPGFYIGANVATRDFLHQAKKCENPDTPFVTLEDHRNDDRFSPNSADSTTNASRWSIDDLKRNAHQLKAIHFPSGPNIYPAMSLRGPGFPIFPITGVTHSISYRIITSFLLHQILRRSLPCDAIVCTSTTARVSLQAQIADLNDHLASLGLKKPLEIQLPIIPLGVDCDRFRPRDKSECRYDLDLPQDNRIILWAGRIHFTDKADLLPILEVIARLVHRPSYRDLLFLFAGDDNQGYGANFLLPRAKELGIADHVVIHNAPSYQCMPLYYGASDIFWSPVDNPQETIGLTPLEAMASGRPLIVSDWDGYRDTVTDQEAGIRIPTLWSECCDDLLAENPFISPVKEIYIASQSVAIDLMELEKALVLLLDSSELRETYGENARKRALAHYSWPVIFRQYHEMWTELERISSEIAPFDKELSRLDRYSWSGYFGNYPTTMLADEDRIVLADEGIERLLREDIAPLKPGAPDYYQPEILHSVIESLSEDDEGAGFPLIQITDQLQESHDISREAARRHVMWLIKYGICRPARK